MKMQYPAARQEWPTNQGPAIGALCQEGLAASLLRPN